MTCEADQRVVLLYHTLGCHLCELAETLITPLASERGWRVELTEISTSDALIALYGTRIPVLRDAAGERELSWPFTAVEVAALLG